MLLHWPFFVILYLKIYCSNYFPPHCSSIFIYIIRSAYSSTSNGHTTNKTFIEEKKKKTTRWRTTSRKTETVGNGNQTPTVFWWLGLAWKCWRGAMLVGCETKKLLNVVSWQWYYVYKNTNTPTHINIKIIFFFLSFPSTFLFAVLS